jgi:hypothetical protein
LNQVKRICDQRVANICRGKSHQGILVEHLLENAKLIGRQRADKHIGLVWEKAFQAVLTVPTD